MRRRGARQDGLTAIAPLGGEQLAGSARMLPFAQPFQAAAFKAAHPAWHGGRVLAEQQSHLRTRLARRRQQQFVPPAVMPRLVIPTGLRLYCQAHHLGILDLQLVHRRTVAEGRCHDSAVMHY